MKRSLYWILAAIAACVAVTVVLRTWMRPSSDTHAQQEQQQAESGGSSASGLNAGRAVTLSPAARARLGVRVVALATSSEQRRITAPAIALSVQSLATMRNAYAMDQANLEKAQVNLGIAQKEYARLKTLYQENQNVSQKSFQAAQGTVDADQVDVRMARQQIALQASLVRQNWGNAVTGWVQNPSPMLDRVLAQEEIFVQVSLPDSEVVSPPPAVWLSLGSMRPRRASFVSSLPQVDPRVQGVSLLYVTPAWAALAPGVTLVAQLPVGRRMRGFTIPASAVIWSNGEAWVYVQTAAGSFIRRPLLSEYAANGGYFVTQGFSSGDKVVVSGAQMLLSVELSPPASSSSGDEDSD